MGKEFGWTPDVIDSLDVWTIQALLHVIGYIKEKEKTGYGSSDTEVKNLL